MLWAYSCIYDCDYIMFYAQLHMKYVGIYPTHYPDPQHPRNILNSDHNISRHLIYILFNHQHG